MAAVALLSRQQGEFTVLLKGSAEQLLLESPRGAKEIFDLETFAMVAAVAALGGGPRGGRMLLFADNKAAACSLISYLQGFRKF